MFYIPKGSDHIWYLGNYPPPVFANLTIVYAHLCLAGWTGTWRVCRRAKWRQLQSLSSFGEVKLGVTGLQTGLTHLTGCCMYYTAVPRLSFMTMMLVLQDQHSFSGKKLRELLLNHGSMKEVNLHIEREFVQDRMSLVNTWHDMLVLGLAQEQTDTVLGGWMTEAKLGLKEGWDELGPKINVDHQYHHAMQLNPWTGHLWTYGVAKDHGEECHEMGNWAWPYQNQSRSWENWVQGAHWWNLWTSRQAQVLAPSCVLCRVGGLVGLVLAVREIISVPHPFYSQ